jgi:IS1 family transposase
MNTVPMERRIQILSALVEGNSIRSIERMTGTHRDTIMRLLQSTGQDCFNLLDRRMRNIQTERIQIDEAWTYVRMKQKQATANAIQSPEVGDQYIFVALDADTKLIPSFWVGKRTSQNALHFLNDLRWRVETERFQLTSDGFEPYRPGVESVFGIDVDYSQLVKIYAGQEAGRERYSPSPFVTAFKTPIVGNPDPNHISTSYVERQNLTLRMSLRRMTRLTNAFSKKLTSLKAALALHFAHYNFLRIHRTLRATPAMAAGLTDHIWEWSELLGG